METISDYIDLVLHNPFMWGIWTERLVYAAGLLLAVWTFKRTKIRGYLLIAAFFTSPYVSLVAREVSHQIHREELKIVAEERDRDLQEKMERGKPIQVDQSINVPIFEALLVLGLFFVSKNQIKSCEQGACHNAYKSAS